MINKTQLFVCPVCGTQSILLYYDYYDINDESTKYNYKVKCTCCSFEINNELDVLDDPNLKIENFWSRK
jgi:hypothetical protein